jgi:hypothetical protein
VKRNSKPLAEVFMDREGAEGGGAAAAATIGEGASLPDSIAVWIFLNTLQRQQGERGKQLRVRREEEEGRGQRQERRVDTLEQIVQAPSQCDEHQQHCVL